MRRLLVFTLPLFALIVACRRETPAPPPPVAAQRPAVAATTTQPAAPRVNRSTPDRCAGDGSYAQAVDCYRQTSRIDFAIEESGGTKASGEMTRPTIGAETIRFDLAGAGADNGQWSAETKKSGIVWSRGGKPVATTPSIADRIWQRTTMYIDPQKKEGEPQRAGTEPLAGDNCIRYHFTDANSAAAHDVWVSEADGHIAAIKVAPTPAFPGYSLTVKKMGRE